LGNEIERKFLVANENWKKCIDRSTKFSQGYIYTGPPTSVRIRIEGVEANLTVKRSIGEMERLEYTYSIPVEDAKDLMKSVCGGRIIQKTRHLVAVGDHVWEIDVFEGENDGLVVAEIELSTVEGDFDRPDWLGKEVTSEARYLNSSLCKTPYGQW